MSLSDVYYLDQQLTKVLFHMEQRGIRINPNYCTEAYKYEVKQRQKVEKEFEELTGEKFLDSNVFFKKVFDKLGEKYPLTEKGNPSFNADALEQIDNQAARLIKRYRLHDQYAGTYYSSFLYFADRDDYIHAHANQAGTVTGRLSYSNPNLQNCPKEDEPEDQDKKFIVRESFIPTERNALVSIDYNQMEFRMMLDYAGEKKIIKRILEGEDVHQATADLTGLTRKDAKTLNFALIYGVGIKLLAKMLGVSESQAKDMKNKYFNNLPAVKRFLNKVIRTGENRGYVRNWLGREYHIDKFEDSYKLPNHLIQGGCAEMCKKAIVEIERNISDSGLIVQIHDELLFDMHPSQFDKIPDIIRIMENVYSPLNGMKFTVSCDWSFKSWAYRDKTMGIPS